MTVHLNLKYLLTVLLSCLFVLCAHAQTQTVTINVKKASLRQVFKAIEAQTTYRISYRNELIDNRSDVTIQCTNAPVERVLNDALKGRKLSFVVVSSHSIVISDRKDAAVSQPSGPGNTISGVVKDDAGDPIVGATVKVKGTNNGAITDIDGQFTVEAPQGSTIVVSYVGFSDRELRASRNMDITITEDTKALDEVVVVGYGTMRRADMTGAISSVNTSELAKRTTTNPAEALQGKIAGVSIMKSGGNAGAGMRVKIRGVKTFGDNAPLYIIDGFPGDIENVNPQDIESMQVLKDGAAAAIYGSMAADGAVHLTTNRCTKPCMTTTMPKILPTP